jgi:1-acyl-sn-glycerol-3-phosphate acyltransferase
VASVRTWRQIGLVKWLIYYVALAILAPFILLVSRLRWTGLEQVPRQGAFLLLANHASTFDPFWDAWLLLRPTRFMGSAQLFRIPGLAWPLEAVGVFPKKKFVKDRASMEVLDGFFRKGLPVMLFPEGTRSFDGRVQRVLPGIGRLTKRLDADLVIVRNLTGHLCHPRWARYPRWVPIMVEYDAPVSFPQEATADEIAAFVQEKITVPHNRPAPRGSWGFRMAHGLEAYLWACPQCFTLDSLSPDPRRGNITRCRHCKARWKIDVSCRLRGLDQAPDTDVWDSNDSITAHFGSPPIADRGRFERDQIILDDLGSIGEVRRGETPHQIGAGRLQLHPDRLALCSPDGNTERWSLPLEDVVAVSIEVKNSLQVRTAEALYQVMPTQGSTIKWGHFLLHWSPGVNQG